MKRGLLLLHADEEVEVANVVALVVESLDLAEGRAETVDFVEEAELGEHALAGGEEDKTGALVDDNRRAAFEEDEIDPSAREGMRCGEADRAATDDDNSEIAGAHLVVSCIGRWSSLVGNANLDALMWRWYLEENACDKHMVFEIGFENSHGHICGKTENTTERFANFTAELDPACQSCDRVKSTARRAQLHAFSPGRFHWPDGVSGPTLSSVAGATAFAAHTHQVFRNVCMWKAQGISSQVETSG